MYSVEKRVHSRRKYKVGLYHFLYFISSFFFIWSYLHFFKPHKCIKPLFFVPFWSNMDSGFPLRLVCRRADILFTLFVFCLRIVVSNTYRVVVSVTWWNLALSNHLNWYFVPSEVFTYPTQSLEAISGKLKQAAKK